MPTGHPEKKELRPLSAHAIAELVEIRRAPEPTSGINPGVFERLKREGLIESVELISPFYTHKNAKCAHAQITEAGLARLKELGR